MARALSGSLPEGSRRRVIACPSRWQDDAGFSLLELVTALAILLVVVGLTVGLIVGLQQQEQGVVATIGGSQQSQLAAQDILEYLGAASSINPGDVAAGASADSLTVESYIGNAGEPSGDGAPVTDSAQIQIVYTGGGGPSGTGRLTVTYTGLSSTGVPNGDADTVSTYAVLAPPNNSPIFTYYEYAATPPSTTVLTAPVTGGCDSKVIAIGINLSFLPGQSGDATHGYASDIPTTLDTVVFPGNISGSTGSTGAAPMQLAQTC
jgi:prepilin-type N-terminal cleavage/methylation domain-containing protein